MPDLELTSWQHALVLFYAGAMGLVVGSYLNVVVYRVPRGLSTVLPRSRCPACGLPVRAIDNIPLLSFLWLRGRCRGCEAPISARYPAVEAATAGLFLLCLWRFGVSSDALIAALLLSILLALALIDAEHFLLPDRITYPGIAVGLLCSLIASWTTPLGSLVGAVVGAAVLLALIGGWYLLRREQGMGFGDVKMLALIGAFLGLRGVAVTLFFASLLGALVGVGLILARRLDARSKLPFGVFLSLGGAVALLAGEWLIGAYLGILVGLP